jgi:hypothetical protein
LNEKLGFRSHGEAQISEEEGGEGRRRGGGEELDGNAEKLSIGGHAYTFVTVATPHL